MEVSAEADVGTQLSTEGAQVSLKSCQGKLSPQAVNERKNRSCRENPGMCQERGREGATEVLSKWQSRKMLCYSTRLAGDEHTAASICQGLRRDAANLTESLGGRFSCLNGYKSPLGQRVRENPLD